uniref:Bicarbonate transporter-like transmembrane domain-containing protein n=1 Tax=Aureoumbra lagunensis TaxID=44058 RepID=A0A6S8BLF9_9STRA
MSSSPCRGSRETESSWVEKDEIEKCCSWIVWCPSTRSSHFRGIKRDLIRRRVYYISDWLEGWNAKTLASTFFMFFTSIAPAVTFAELLEGETDSIGVVEVCLSSALSGMIFSIFAGQPLVILGVTGPVSILTISIFGMSESMGIKFLPFYAWSQIFAAIMHLIIASLGLCDYIKYITNFSCHTFGILIAVIYFVTGARGISGYFLRDQPFDTALAELIIALGTAGCALYLSKARDWPILTKFLRNLITDYAPTVSILAWTIISLLGRMRGQGIPRLDVPNTFRTLNGRAWFASNLFKLPPWAIVLALVPATIITVLFIFDHNVSSIMAQSREFQLKKGSAYHLDFFVLGFCILTTGLLGIPPCNGLIPQAPLHTKSLCVLTKGFSNGVEIDIVDHTYEIRYTNFFQAFLTGVVCFKPFLIILGKIPKASLDGLFIFMALSSLGGNELWDRFVLLVSEPARRISRHDFFRTVQFDVMAKYTKLQLAAVVLIFVVTLTPVAMAFPLFIAALVYIRTRILPKHFNHSDLLSLDPLIPLDHVDHQDAEGASDDVEVSTQPPPSSIGFSDIEEDNWSTSEHHPSGRRRVVGFEHDLTPRDNLSRTTQESSPKEPVSFFRISQHEASHPATTSNHKKLDDIQLAVMSSPSALAEDQDQEVSTTRIK